MIEIAVPTSTQTIEAIIKFTIYQDEAVVLTMPIQLIHSPLLFCLNFVVRRPCDIVCLRPNVLRPRSREDSYLKNSVIPLALFGSWSSQGIQGILLLKS